VRIPLNLYTMIFLIVVIVAIADIVKKVATHKANHRDMPDNDRIPNLEAALQRMETRLANLETIVTSKDYNLKKEFESL